MRRALLALVVLGPALALAQPSEPPVDAGLPSQPSDGGAPDAGATEAEPATPTRLDEEPTAPPTVGETLRPETSPLAADTQDIGLGFLLGVAACRSGAYTDDPLLAAIEVGGQLVEKPSDLKAVFDAVAPWTKKGRWYSEEVCRGLRTLAENMRYYVEVQERPGPAGLTVSLALRPMTLVRHIVVRGNATVFDFALSPIYREEIVRRMKLRPGESLEEDQERRRQQLAAEEQRIVEYLGRRGFFDAQVKVGATVGARLTEVTVNVDIVKGDPYTVGKVGAEGNTALDDATIADVMRQRTCPFTFLCLWQARFNYEELQNDLEKVRATYQERGYPGVRLTTTYSPSESADHATKTVNFNVIARERKRITVTFEGNKSKDERTLRKLLTFNEAGAYDDIEAESSTEAIRRAYQASGRFQTTVSFERTREQPSAECPTCAPHDTLVFRIVEGPEQRVRTIDFRGNTTFSAGDLRDKVVTKPFPRIRYVFGSGGYLTTLQVQQDVERIDDFYRSEGFSRVKTRARVGNAAGVYEIGAVAAQVTAGDRGDGLHILFEVNEGPRDVVAAVVYHGNSELDAEALAEGAKIKPGAPFTPSALDFDVERLLDVYRDRGFLYVNVKPTPTGSGAETRVDFFIDEGVRVHAGKLVVRGNFRTRPWVIEDAFDLDEGEVMTVERLEASQGRLRATDLFAGVRQQLVGRDPLNLIVNIEERFDYKLELRLAGGYSTDNNVFISLASDMRHIGGVGVSLGINGELGLERQRAQATLVLPQWVMRRSTRLPMSFELQGRYRSEDTPRFGIVDSFGFSAALSRQLAQGVVLSLRYDWNRFGRSTELLRPPGPDLDLVNIPISTTTAALGPILLIDRRRPTVLAPSRGYMIHVLMQVASRYLLGTDDFLKLGIGGQLFLPVGTRIIITNTMRYDQGIPLAGAVLLPEIERFTAGGDTTVRGIAEDRLATEIIASPLEPASDVTAFRIVPAGGNIRGLYKLDAQARLYDIAGPDVALASALFLDTGFIANSFFRFDIPRRFRHSVGAAIRFLSPVVNLSLEWAFPLDPEIGDDPRGRLHFNLGVAFAF